MKFSITDFFSKFDQIRSFLFPQFFVQCKERIWNLNLQCLCNIYVGTGLNTQFLISLRWTHYGDEKSKFQWNTTQKQRENCRRTSWRFYSNYGSYMEEYKKNGTDKKNHFFVIILKYNVTLLALFTSFLNTVHCKKYRNFT